MEREIQRSVEDEEVTEHTSQPESARVEEDRLNLSGHIFIRLNDKSWRELFEDDGDWFPVDAPMTVLLEYVQQLKCRLDRSRERFEDAIKVGAELQQRLASLERVRVAA